MAGTRQSTFAGYPIQDDRAAALALACRGEPARPPMQF